MNGLKKLYSENTGEWGASIYSFKAEEYEIVDSLSASYNIKELCEVMNVSRSGYYKWKNRVKSNQEKKREELISIVKKHTIVILRMDTLGFTRTFSKSIKFHAA